MRPPPPLMRYHGGKFRLAPWIIGFFPPHQTYVEPFGGAAGVLLQKDRSESELYNDLDGEIVNVFRQLQDRSAAQELQRLLSVTPYSRAEFEKSYEPTDDPIERARRTLIRAHMGFGSAGATKHATGFRIDTARKYGTAAHLWASYPLAIPRFVDRLMDVVLENKPAAEVMKNHDRPETLFFVDPPYVHETRSMRKGGYYAHEMTDEQHFQLLDQLESLSGMVVLSGYESDLYRDRLTDWTQHKTKARISAGSGTDLRTESVWLNPACQSKQYQPSLL